MKKKTITLIWVIALILSAVAILISYFTYRRDIDEYYKYLTKKLSMTEALAVDSEALAVVADKTSEIYKNSWEVFGNDFDPEDMDEEQEELYYAQYDEIYKMPEYKHVLKQLQDIAEANEVMYMYINLWDIERGKVIYLIDGSVRGDLTPTGCVEKIEDDNLKKLRSGDFDLPTYITNYEEYGWLCTATSDIYDSKGEVIAHAYVDISMNAVRREQVYFLIQITILQLLITMVLASIVMYGVNRVLINPINLLSKAADKYIACIDNPSEVVFDNLDIHTGDEVENLYHAIAKMEESITDYIDHITEITAEKERIGAELNVATQIQADMLPSIFPAFPGRNDIDIYATMDPAKEVGGDFYDFFLVDDNHLAMVMADVAGKGVPASLFMVIAKTLIKNRTLMGGTPAEILADVNEQLCEGNDAGMFVTVWLGILDLTTGKGVAANAGHEHPVICRAGGNYELVINRHSPALATIEGIRFRQHDFEMFPGDKLFVYTDGVPEATDIDEKMFGLDRMLESLNRSKDCSTAGVLHNVQEDLTAFVGDAPQFDDFTMLVLYYYGKEA